MMTLTSRRREFVATWRRIVEISIEEAPIEEGVASSWRPSGRGSLEEVLECPAHDFVLRKEQRARERQRMKGDESEAGSF
jgi:hypothetical protein